MILFGLLVLAGFLFVAYWSVHRSDTRSLGAGTDSVAAGTTPGDHRVGRYLSLGRRGVRRSVKAREADGFPRY